MIEIDYLCNHPTAVADIVDWYFDEWFAAFGLTREEVVEIIQDRCRRCFPPIAFVAMRDQSPIGVANLIFEVEPDNLTAVAGMSGLFVLPTARNQGVGKQLCHRVVAAAESFGFPKLGLYTIGHASWYARMGWQLRSSHIDCFDGRSTSYNYMEICLTSGDGSGGASSITEGH